MATRSDLYTAIKSMVLDADLGFLNNEIFSSPQSNTNFPKNGNFCYFQYLNRKPTSITPSKIYNGADETINTQSLYEYPIQIVFVGKDSIDRSMTFDEYLRNFAADYLLENTDFVRMGYVINNTNITKYLGRNVFEQQTKNLFVLYALSDGERSLNGADATDLTLKYIQ